MTYAKSIVLFNSRSNFVFKISLFRCNVNEISIILIIFIFLFYRENFQKRKIQSRNAYALTKFEPPLPLYVPARFRHDSPFRFSTCVRALCMALYWVRCTFFITHPVLWFLSVNMKN